MSYKENHIKTKPSFTALLTLISVSTIVFTTVTITIVFFINFRSVTNRQIETLTKESVSRLQENMLHIFKTYEDLIRYSATGVNTLLKTYAGDVPQDIMQEFFIEMIKIVPDASFLYYSNNIQWNQPGGYFVFHNGWVPNDPAYDQTTSPWFIAAKAKNGEIAYSDPYVDVSYGNLTIALSMTLFDEAGQDMGVVCEEITVESLEDILKTGSGQNKMYLLDKNGICIIDADGDTALETNFFQKTNLDSYHAAIFAQDTFAGRNNTYFIYSAHIPGVDYYLVSLLPVALISAEVNRLLFVILGVGFGILLLSTLLTFLVTRKITPSFTSQEQNAVALANDIDKEVKIVSDQEAGISSAKEEFESITTELKDNINEIVASIENISDAVLRAEEISDENRQNIDVLIKEVSRLKIRDTWLPNGRKNQLDMAKNWGMVLKANAADWNIPCAEVTELVTLTAEADAVLTEAQHSRRTPFMTEKCKGAFDALTTKMRSIKNQYFCNPPLMDVDFSTLNLKPKNTNHSPVSSLNS